VLEVQLALHALAEREDGLNGVGGGGGAVVSGADAAAVAAGNRVAEDVHARGELGVDKELAKDGDHVADEQQCQQRLWGREGSLREWSGSGPEGQGKGREGSGSSPGRVRVRRVIDSSWGSSRRVSRPCAAAELRRE